MLTVCVTAHATDPYKKNPAIDVVHYYFHLEVNDSTDVIKGNAKVSIAFREPVASFDLNLTSKNQKGNGMTVSSVKSSGKPVEFTHEQNLVHIVLTGRSQAGDTLTFEIDYSGKPEDGFIIGRNKFGDRTFFGDNWPDRGRNWLPSIDHPSDKAPVDFAIVAPHHYQVVATGRLVEETDLPHARKLTRYSEPTPVAVKVMAVGIARFAVQYTASLEGVQLSTWVYPQNRDDGFHDFGYTIPVLDFFQRYIGPYPFAKLAHVQSKTRWGGLENAGNIFYTEGSVTGKAAHEGLIAHETAHQWFGNSATENDWQHVWLSEGFATYMTALYFENRYGKERLQQELKNQRTQVIAYDKKDPRPIVDTTMMDINRVLSTLTYQKAAWVLHMLRREVGDANFQGGVRRYYSKFENRNAMTADFQQVMEEFSGKDLDQFFQEWLFKPGHPILDINWKYDSKKKEVTITVVQKQKDVVYHAPLDVLLKGKDNALKTTVKMAGEKTEIRLKVDFAVTEMEADPDTLLLFEGRVANQGR